MKTNVGSFDRPLRIVAGIALIALAATGTIILGFLRGTVFGAIKDLDGLGTTYGIWWLVGLIAACATYAYGTGPSQHALTDVANSCCSEISYGYDALGRLAQTARGGNAETVTITYDTAGTAITRTPGSISSPSRRRWTAFVRPSRSPMNAGVAQSPGCGCCAYSYSSACRKTSALGK